VERTTPLVVSGTLEPFKQRSTRSVGVEQPMVALSLGHCTGTDENACDWWKDVHNGDPTWRGQRIPWPGDAQSRR
jgi:hypothetical protein